MGNYWLNKDTITEAKFFELVENVKRQRKIEEESGEPSTPEATLLDKELQQILYVLAKEIMEHINYMRHPPTLFELVGVAWSELDSFNGKAKAFNYFTTVMLGHLKQIWRNRESQRSNKNGGDTRSSDLC